MLSEEGVSAEQPIVQREEVHSVQEPAVMSAVQALEGLVKQVLLNQVLENLVHRLACLGYCL